MSSDTPRERHKRSRHMVVDGSGAAANATVSEAEHNSRVSGHASSRSASVEKLNQTPPSSPWSSAPPEFATNNTDPPATAGGGTAADADEEETTAVAAKSSRAGGAAGVAGAAESPSRVAAASAGPAPASTRRRSHGKSSKSPAQADSTTGTEATGTGTADEVLPAPKSFWQRCGCCAAPPTPVTATTADEESTVADETQNWAEIIPVQDDVIGHSRIYPFVSEGFPPERFDYTSMELEWTPTSRYDIRYSERLGEGAFGEVFSAWDTVADLEVCVKTIKPEKYEVDRIKKEIRMLELVRGGPYVVEMRDLVHDVARDLKMIVFEIVRVPYYATLYASLTDLEIRAYLYRLLMALDFAHSLGIMHRDVKAGNVLYDADNHVPKLIDWGFAEFYRPDVSQNNWPGTRSYKSPDMFLHYARYDYSVDMWSFGCLMGSLIFQRFPFFRAQPNDDKLIANQNQMQAIVRYLGIDDYVAYLQKYPFPAHVAGHFQPKSFALKKAYDKRYDFAGLRSSKTLHATSDDALALLDALLVYDHEHRLTAVEAMEHAYFDPVRDAIRTQGPAASFRPVASNNTENTATDATARSHSTDSVRREGAPGDGTETTVATNCADSTIRHSSSVTSAHP